MEGNKYFDQATQQIKNGNGLRIYQIKTGDGQGNWLYKTYKYGQNENGYGECYLTPRVDFMSYETGVFYQAGGGDFSPSCDGLWYRKRVFTSDFIPDLGLLAAQPLAYAEVTEYLGTETTNTGKSIYQYNLFTTATPTSLMMAVGIPKYHVGTYNFWNSNALRVKSDYKRIDNQGVISYSLQRKVESLYDERETEKLYSLRVRRNAIYPQNGETYPVAPYAWPAPGGYVDRWRATYMTPSAVIYAFGNQTISLGYKNLLKTIDTTYSDNSGFLVNETQYTYNADNFISKVDKKVSNDAVVTQTIKYPADFTTDPNIGAVSQLMISPTVNMLNHPVEEIESKGATPLKSKKTNYYNWGNNIIAPQTIQIKQAANAYETRLRYYSYDANGNPLSISKELDSKVSFLWDYSNLYPVAEIINADQADVAFTSFEAEGKGSWSYDGLISMDASAPTGKKVYNLYNGAISRNISSAKAYTLSFWAKTQPTVGNAIFKQSGRTLNGYTYYEYRTSPSATNVQISGSTLIDELRLYPVGSQMNTYSFEPLVGITAQCDINNRITYYQYDNFSRLFLIRDQDRKIIKKFCYSYQDQSENCTVYGNDVQSGNFIKQCSGGQTASTVTYTVPASTYYAFSKAEANALAQAEVAQNGQTYANQNGTCTNSVVDVTGSNYQPAYNKINYKITFTNVSNTSQTYQFTLSTTDMGAFLGQVPSGIWNVKFEPSTLYSPPAATFKINGLSAYFQYGATFNNVTINSMTGAICSVE